MSEQECSGLEREEAKREQTSTLECVEDSKSDVRKITSDVEKEITREERQIKLESMPTSERNPRQVASETRIEIMNRERQRNLEAMESSECEIRKVISDTEIEISKKMRETDLECVEVSEISKKMRETDLECVEVPEVGLMQEAKDILKKVTRKLLEVRDMVVERKDASVSDPTQTTSGSEKQTVTKEQEIPLGSIEVTESDPKQIASETE
jgi:hypothetical protein